MTRRYSVTGGFDYTTCRHWRPDEIDPSRAYGTCEIKRKDRCDPYTWGCEKFKREPELPPIRRQVQDDARGDGQ